MLAGHLVTLHNIHYYLNLMGELREAIRKGRIDAFVARCNAGWAESERGV